MGNAFRPQPFPAYYPDNKTPVTEDVLQVGLLFAFSIIAFSFILIIPGIRGWERLWATLRVSVAIFVGAVILVSSYGYCWYCDTQCVRTQYKAYVFPANAPQEIEAQVGLFIGLRAINVTLREVSVVDCLGSSEEDHYVRPFEGETINYNDRYWWADPWAQGRLGFGRFAGELNREFRAAQFRGVPYPILWIAEYFTLDGEQIRWGRKYRVAGWNTQFLLWVAFGTYILSILLFIFVIRLGAWFMFLTGLLMVLACFAFGIIIINDPIVAIPFANEIQGTVRLTPTFGWSFYLTLLTGIALVILGVVVLLMDYFVPRQIAVVFHHSTVEEDEFFQVEEEEGEEKPSLEEYGVASRGARTTRGRTTRGRTTRRGLSRYRQTQRKPRSTVRTNRGGSQRLHDDIQLEEIPKES